MSLSKPWSTAEAFHTLGSLAKVPLMKRPLTTPAKKSLGKYKQPSSLVLWLRFWTGAGATVYDFSRYGNNGAVIGMTWGKDGGLTVGVFNGITDYLRVPHDASLNVVNGITASAGVKPNSVTGYRTILDKNLGWTTILQLNGNLFQPYLKFTIAGLQSVDAPAVVVVGNWYYIAAVYDGNAFIAYQDEAAGAPNIIGVDTISVSASDVHVGDYIGTRFFDGLIAEIRVYILGLIAMEQRALHLGLI